MQIKDQAAVVSCNVLPTGSGSVTLGIPSVRMSTPSLPAAHQRVLGRGIVATGKLRGLLRCALAWVPGNVTVILLLCRRPM